MTQALYILLAISAGLGSAVQTALLGSLSRERGSWEASFISALASIGGLAFILGVRTSRDSNPSLPAPFDTVVPFAGIALITGVSLALARRPAKRPMKTTMRPPRTAVRPLRRHAVATRATRLLLVSCTVSLARWPQSPPAEVSEF